MLADAPVPALATHVEQQPADWTLLRVGPSGRTVVVGAWGGGCAGRLQATVAEQNDAKVTLSVTFPTPVPDDPQEQILCPAIARRGIVTVKLDAPLDGRALPGQSRLGMSHPLGAPLPRLIGTRARDASLSLRNQGYVVHLAGPLDGEVVRERPSRAAEDDRDVTIVAVPRR